MQIHKVTLRNLHSIRSHVVIDFKAEPLAGTGLFAITGDTGAGKTTILDAITLALYGKICRNADETEALSYGAEEGFAECEFEAKGRIFKAQWSIRRRRSTKENNFRIDRMVAELDPATGQFHTVAERKVREIDAFVEEVTGLDFPRFTRSVLLAQGDFAAFLKAAPKERSELLERLTGTEIYSELSKAALQRHTEEKAKLSALVSQREQLKVFSKEELKELKSSLKEGEKAAKQQKAELDAAHKALSWLEQLASATAKRQAANEALELLKQKKAAAQADMGRLALHRKTLPFQPELARFDELTASQTQIAAQLDSLRQAQLGLATAEASAQAQFEAKTLALQSLKGGQSEAFQLFEKVAKLDEQIGHESADLTKLQADLGLWQQKKSDATALAAAHRERIGSAEKSVEELEAWLREHAAWEALPQELGTIKLYRTHLQENWRQKTRLTAEAAENEKALEKTAAERALVEAELARLTALLRENESRFQQFSPPAFTVGRHDLLEKLRAEIEALGELQQRINQFNGLADNYKKGLAELADLESTLDSLRSEQLSLEKMLLSALEEAEEWEQQLEYRLEIYRQQQQVANYEKDRSNLALGEPCPLCGATDHPFRHHAMRPFVDEARRDFETAERAFKARQARRNELQQAHFQATNAIHQLDHHSTGRIHSLEDRLSALEHRMASMLPGIEDEDFARSHGDWLEKKLSAFEESLNAKKTAREQLALINREMSVQEEALRKQEGLLQAADNALAQGHERRLDKQRSLDEHSQRFKEMEGELNQLIGKYGYVFSLTSAAAMFTDLEAREKDFSIHQYLLQGHQTQIVLDQQALQQAVQADEEANQVLVGLESRAAEKTAGLQRAKATRADLFGDKSPQREREALLRSIGLLEQAQADARAGHEKAVQAVLLNQQNLAHWAESHQATVAGLAKVQASLEAGAGAAGFADLDSLRQAVLPSQAAAAMEELLENLRLREVETGQQARSAEAEWQAAQAKQLTDKSLAELSAEIAALDARFQSMLQAIGALRQQIDDNEKQRETAEQLLKMIEEQRSASNRWAALYDLIGSGDGKKFRIFAQGLTLQKLVQLANQHLRNLYGRYHIVKRAGEDLELDIVDSYQADSERSMHTLSGGESFLVSLALALGLSELAGRNANIRSLFIDEGFGTLDDQALDLALSTLENLQAKGKTIGIISHVKELKERIATQVRVVKRGGGTSIVEVV